MNKAERNSFGQSGEPKKLQAPAKRRELAKKMSKAIERKKNLEHRMKVESESRYGKGHNSLGIPYKK